MFTSTLLMQSFFSVLIQMLGVGSAAIFYLSALPLFFSLVVNAFITGEGDISLWTYALGQANPLFTGTLMITAVSEVFVPLVRTHTS